MLTFISLGSSAVMLLLIAAAVDTRNFLSAALFKVAPAIIGILCAWTFMIHIKEMYPDF